MKRMNWTGGEGKVKKNKISEVPSGNLNRVRKTIVHRLLFLYHQSNSQHPTD